MKTFRITFTVRCPRCGENERPTFRGMGDSHVEWIMRLAKEGTYPGWHCSNCRSSVDAELSAVSTNQEGA